MRGNFFYSVKNLSKDENLAFTYYLYKISTKFVSMLMNIEIMKKVRLFIMPLFQFLD